MKNKKTQVGLKIILPVFGILLLVCTGLFFLLQHKAVWIVEDRYVEVWEKVLASSPSPLRGAKVIPLSAEGNAPRFRYGYIIGSAPQPRVSGEDEGPVVHRRLAETGQDGEALILTVDPWLVFRKFTSPSLSREQAENGPGESGRIFMAGSDRAAVLAWTAQLLQETPGVFSHDSELRERTEDQLFSGRVFQTGAGTYTWEEIWPYLLEDDETVWVYAPLSRIRKLPVYQTNILEANVFPGKPGWNEFGFQAEFLRAIPYGSQKDRKKLEPVANWLRDPFTQSSVADALGVIAAHPESEPFNPVSGSARIAWLTASYVWELTE
jgi:hypothetical protein